MKLSADRREFCGAHRSASSEGPLGAPRSQMTHQEYGDRGHAQQWDRGEHAANDIPQHLGALLCLPARFDSAGQVVIVSLSDATEIRDIAVPKEDRTSSKTADAAAKCQSFVRAVREHRCISGGDASLRRDHIPGARVYRSRMPLASVSRRSTTGSLYPVPSALLDALLYTPLSAE